MCNNRYLLDKLAKFCLENLPNIIILKTIAVKILLIICINENI